MALTRLPSFTLLSTDSYTFGNASVTGNVTSGNILTDNLLHANGVAWTFGGTYSNSNVAAYLPTYTGNVAAGNILTNNLLYANGVAWSFGSTYSNSNVAAYLPTYTGNVSANYFIGNGSTLTNIAGGNVSGQVGNALVAGTVYTNAQPNITSLGTLSSVTVTGLVTATAGGVKVGNIQDPSGTNTIQLTSGSIVVTGNITAGGGGTGNVSATYFIGNGSTLTSIAGANVTGTVANATYATTSGSATTAATVTSAAQPNITSVGTLASLTVTGNTTSGNIAVTSLLSASTITTSGGTGNISGANNISANTFTGNLTTAAQPNITSVGTLSSLIVTGNANVGNVNATDGIFSGNATVTGNLVVNGTTITANVTTMNVKDPIIEMGGNTSGALTSNDGKDRGTLLHYYTTVPVDAFMGWDNSNGEFAFGSNVTLSSEVATFNTFGNVRVGNIIGAGSLTSLTVSGNTTSGNLSVTSVLSASTITTSGGTGNISGANNISANTFTGNLITAAQPNITSIGTLASLSVTANITSGNISGGNLVSANYISGNGLLLTSLTGGNVSGQVGNALVSGTVYTAAQPNITSVGTLASLSVTGNVSSAAYIVGNGAYLTGLPASYANSNVAAYLPTYTGNVSANYFIGNGSTLTNITGGNVIGQVANALVAGTVYTAAQPNITSVGTLASLSVTANITSGNLLTDHLYYANGTAWSFGGTPGGSNTYIQFNDSSSFGGSSGLTFDKGTTRLTSNNFTVTTSANLGAVGNVTITGGTSGQVLSTDGSGTLSWATMTAANITVDTFTGDGSNVTFTLSVSPANANVVIVNYNGATLLHDTYSISGANITFVEAPANGYKFDVTTVNAGASSGSSGASRVQSTILGMVFGG